MHQPYYPFEQTHPNRYTFVSHGKRRIKKAVEFNPTFIKGVYNIGFGDLLEDDTIDDIVSSNNGDMITVLSTVIQIIRAFTARRRGIKIYFTGSTQERTRLYGRILSTYYDAFCQEFIVTAWSPSNDKETSFNPASFMTYTVFFVKRIS